MPTAGAAPGRGWQRFLTPGAAQLAVEDRRGPTYLELGLTLSGDFDGDNYLNFRAALHGVPANELTASEDCDWLAGTLNPDQAWAAGQIKKTRVTMSWGANNKYGSNL